MKFPVSQLKPRLRRIGLNFCSTDRLGVDVEADLARSETEEPFKTIFDIAGNFGHSTRAFPHATVLSFEPVPDSFLQLAVHTGKNFESASL
jgi:hypothetical protein